MRKIALVLLLLVGCRDGRLQQVTKCGHECGSAVGVCRQGVWVCPDDKEELATCEGGTGPSEETCDGLDNDCDGQIDESLTRSCDNACGKGTEICTAGVFHGCTAPLPSPEVCDGKDNNCDGRVDEADGLPIEYCYDGPSSSLQFGNCRPGVQRCEFGHKSCVGQVLPRPEICNGEDDDCDGVVDEGTNQGDPVDIVFIIDNSGSMTQTISAVKQATATFSNTYSTRTDIRWALVVAPDPDPYYDSQVRLRQNFTTAGTFNAAVQQMAATGGGEEATLDALMFLTDPQNPLMLSWRAGSRHVLVLFTDENPQSYTTPKHTEAEANAAIANTGTRLYAFIDTYVQADWQPVLPAGWGQMKDLSGVASTMEQELTSIIEETTCQ